MIFLADVFLCLACFRFARWELFRTRAGREARRFYPVLWAALAFVLALLAMQQATGWLDYITNAARQDAVAEGWYADRRPFQWLLVKTVPVLAFIVGIGAFWIIRRDWRRYGLVVVATLYWLGYAVIQGISFHNVDWLLRQRFAGLQNKTWGDLVGMALTASALVVAWQQDRRQSLVWEETSGSRAREPRRDLPQLLKAARQSLRAEGRIFSGWYLRYRASRHRAPSRKK